MNKHLDIHNKVLESSVKALEYAQKKARKLDADIPEANVLLLDKLEHKASEQNVLFSLYQQAKKQYRVRPTNDQLKTLANSGQLSVDGLDLTYNRSEKKAFINETPVYSEPLLEAGQKPTDASVITFSHQRQVYLTESIVNQRSYITHDSKGHVDGFGNEINSQHDIQKAKEALTALEPDINNINPRGLFLTNLTAQQKVGVMLSNISESKDRIKSLFGKITSNEIELIDNPIHEQHRRKLAQDMASRKISPSDALNRPTSHTLDSGHEFVKKNLSEVEGLNNTASFPLNYIKHMPKGYITVKEHLDKMLEPPYDLGDDDMHAIAKQMMVFDDAKHLLSNKSKLNIDFTQGVDDERFYVTTNRISHGQLHAGQSAVMDSNGRFSQVSSGDFGITKSGTLRKGFDGYDAVIVTVGALASGSFAKAIEDNQADDKEVLVIDALEDSNVVDVLSSIRGSYRTPLVVFSDNKRLHEYLENIEDKSLTSYVSKEHKWGELGIGLLRDNTFNDFQKGVEQIVDYAVSKSNTTFAETTQDTPSPSKPNILMDEVDEKPKTSNDNSSNEIQQSTQTISKGFK